MHLLPNLTHVIGTYGYLGVFIIVFLESGVFFALPGDSLLFTAGLMASTYGLYLWILIPIIFVATFLGGMAGYYIGTRLDTLYKYAFFRRVIKKEHIDKTHDFFERHGKWTVIISRFVPIVRTFTPIVAGIGGMKKHLFIRYSVISSVLWATIVTLIGFYLGRAFPQIKDYMSVIFILIIFVSLVPGVVQIVRNNRSKRCSG